MANSKIVILEQLSKRPMTLNELHKATGYSKTGIRGRISELRKQGYNIELGSGSVKKYILNKKESSNGNKVLSFIEKRNLFGIILEIDKLAKKLKLSNDIIEKELIALYKDNRVIQISNNKVIIKNKKV